MPRVSARLHHNTCLRFSVSIKLPHSLVFLILPWNTLAPTLPIMPPHMSMSLPPMKETQLPWQWVIILLPVMLPVRICKIVGMVMRLTRYSRYYTVMCTECRAWCWLVGVGSPVRRMNYSTLHRANSHSTASHPPMCRTLSCARARILRWIWMLSWTRQCTTSRHRKHRLPFW